MKPEDVAAMRALHGQASSEIDAAPDSAVRAAVLAAAARAVDAKPRAADAPAAAPFGRRRWPVSMAALLVVSLMTGLVVNQALRDEPERVTSATAPPAVQTPAPSPAPAATAEAAPEPAAPEARPTSPTAKRERPRADHGHALGGATRDAVPAGSTGDAAPAAKIVAPPLTEPAPPPPPAPAPGPARAAAPALAESAVDAPSVARPGQSMNTAQRIRRGPEPLTPEAWVERIVKLRERGDGAAADREVEALRARYPDFEIPAAALGTAGTR